MRLARCFPTLCKELKRRPLLYVPFENGGQPAAILKARMLQSVIRVLLSQLPRLGMLEETFELLADSAADGTHAATFRTGRHRI